MIDVSLAVSLSTPWPIHPTAFGPSVPPGSRPLLTLSRGRRFRRSPRRRWSRTRRGACWAGSCGAHAVLWSLRSARDTSMTRRPAASQPESETRWIIDVRVEAGSQSVRFRLGPRVICQSPTGARSPGRLVMVLRSSARTSCGSAAIWMAKCGRLKWARCGRLKWPHLRPIAAWTVASSWSSSGRGREGWVPGWRRSSRSGAIVIVRGSRSGRWRRVTGCIGGR